MIQVILRTKVNLLTCFCCFPKVRFVFPREWEFRHVVGFSLVYIFVLCIICLFVARFVPQDCVRVVTRWAWAGVRPEITIHSFVSVAALKSVRVLFLALFCLTNCCAICLRRLSAGLFGVAITRMNNH